MWLWEKHYFDTVPDFILKCAMDPKMHPYLCKYVTDKRDTHVEYVDGDHNKVNQIQQILLVDLGNFEMKFCSSAPCQKILHPIVYPYSRHWPWDFGTHDTKICSPEFQTCLLRYMHCASFLLNKFEGHRSRCLASIKVRKSWSALI